MSVISRNILPDSNLLLLWIFFFKLRDYSSITLFITELLLFFVSQIFRKAVYHHMKGNLFRRVVMERLHIYSDSNVPEEVMENITNQIPPLRSIPKTLGSYSKEEIEKYPKIIDYPEDFILSKN